MRLAQNIKKQELKVGTEIKFELQGFHVKWNERFIYLAIKEIDYNPYTNKVSKITFENGIGIKTKDYIPKEKINEIDYNLSSLETDS
jgi:hypothetical protein